MTTCNTGSSHSTRAATPDMQERRTSPAQPIPEKPPHSLATAFPPPDLLSPVPDTFVFELNQKRTRVSDQVLLDQLRDFSRSLGGRAFAAKEFNAWPARRISARCIMVRFGTWRKALAAAGIHGAFAGRYSSHELMERLELAWRAIGRRPGVKSLRRHARVTTTPYRHRWGTYMKACTLFVQFKKGEITLKDLLHPPLHLGRKSISPGTRWKILHRDGHRCRACGRSADDRGIRLEVDHIIPVCAGGTDDPENLRALCKDCNRGKAGRKLSNSVSTGCENGPPHKSELHPPSATPDSGPRSARRPRHSASPGPSVQSP